MKEILHILTTFAISICIYYLCSYIILWALPDINTTNIKITVLLTLIDVMYFYDIKK